MFRLQCHPERSEGPTQSSRIPAIRKKLASLLNDAQGAAILEFAISLPLLVVFVVGIYDFSGAFNQKQKIAQAAQEGAIMAGAQTMGDIQTISGVNTDSLQPVVFAVFNSLTASKVIQCSCSPPGSVTGPAANLAWTYKITGCPDQLTIVISRGLVIAGTTGNPSAIATTVQVQYPYHWRFNSVIQSLIPGANYAATTQVSESATVHNQM
jgi:Flp pilus assembly protein TadG